MQMLDSGAAESKIVINSISLVLSTSSNDLKSETLNYGIMALKFLSDTLINKWI